MISRFGIVLLVVVAMAIGSIPTAEALTLSGPNLDVYAAGVNVHGTLTADLMVDDDPGTFCLIQPAIPAQDFIILDVGITYPVDAIHSLTIDNRNNVTPSMGQPKDLRIYYFDDDDPSNNANPWDIDGDADIILAQAYTGIPDVDIVTHQLTNPILGKRYLGVKLDATNEATAGDSYQIAELSVEAEVDVEMDWINPEMLTANASSWGHDGRVPELAINGSGLIPVSETGTWVHSTSATSQWLSRIGPTGSHPAIEGQWFEIKLGEATALGEMKIWNNNEAKEGYDYTGRQVNDFKVWVANDPTLEPALNDTSETFLPFDFEAAGWTQIGGVHSMDSHVASNDYTGETPINLGGVTATNVAIEILSNHGDANWLGLAEIQLTAVPEPSTIVFMVAGLFGLLVFRHRI